MIDEKIAYLKNGRMPNPEKDVRALVDQEQCRKTGPQ
jgi:hypothetical protein